MPLSPGTRIGGYEVTGIIGAGGMGEVYRARDLKLDREVALKVLPELFTNDADRLARFEREAKVLASLNHPNIAQVFGYEASSTGPSAIAMELVDGPTLADRIAVGPLPVTEAIAIARQIADALGAAHESGVIHRDLKPANVKVREDGTVKVLDFGLAKAFGAPGSDESGQGMAANSPTLTARATAMGMIIGTAAYMAPEQARGKSVDRRADLWAFGVVLYEMLAGRRAFEGAEVTDVLASVIRDTPPLDSLPSDVPPGVRRLLRRTLEKDRSRRLDSMAAARLELDDVETAPAATASAAPTAPRSSTGSVLAVIAAILVSALATGAIVWRNMQPAPATPTRVTITPAADAAIAIETNHNDVGITADGTRVVYFSKASGGQNQMVVRPVDSFEPRVLTQLGQDARSVSVSPDGEWIAYQAGQPNGDGAMLFKAPLDGGTPVPISRITGNLRGVAWLPDNTLVFATVARQTGLFRVPGGGGTPELLTTPSTKDGELDHLWPSVLPDGKHVLFALNRTDATFDVALLSLESKTWRVLIKNGQFPRYIDTGHILYGSAGSLRAVPFDMSTLTAGADSVEVVRGIVTKESGAADFSVSNTGTLVYLPGSNQSAADRLAWREPDGKMTATGFPAADYGDTRISPDRQFGVTTVGTTTSQAGLWLLDSTREVSSRLTPPGMRAVVPVWSPDSRRVAFWAEMTGASESGGIFVVSVTGTSAPERLTTAPAGIQHRPGGWTPDGGVIVFAALTPDFLQADLMQVRTDASHTVTPVLEGPSLDAGPALSPDGRWLAHSTIESQAPRLFIRPFPNVNDERIPVSAGAGQAAVWALDGKALYFRDGSNRTVFSVTTTPASKSLNIGKPAAVINLTGDTNAFRFASMPPVNGRMLHRVVDGSTPSSEYRVVFNWIQELVARTKK